MLDVEMAETLKDVDMPRYRPHSSMGGWREISGYQDMGETSG
jgi:hypothetical protein